MKEPVDYVNPNMGGIGQLLDRRPVPFVKLPYGVMSVSPITTPGVDDRYTADKIYGFPAGGVTLMPMSGSAETEPAKYASWYDHDLETATPYYYAAILEDSNIEVEYTVSEHAAYYRLTFPAGASAHVLFSMPDGGEINLAEHDLVQRPRRRRPGRSRQGRLLLRRVLQARRLFQGSHRPAARHEGRARKRERNGRGIMADFSPGRNKQIGIRVGISTFSIDQARQNLQSEIPAWDFDRARAQARTTWNEALSKIAVKGGTEEQRTVFYTCLYRVLTSISNYG